MWKTITTEHFRITFYATEEEIALHVAELAESIHRRLVPAIGWAPSELTEVLLTDQTDSANGSASPLPYDAVRLNVTAPDDMSPLGDVDDWYLELVTHEYSHILHTDRVGGIPALINRLVGKTFAPNQVQPHWLLEGLAVFEESSKTTGGRLRSSMWNMFMRADVLENNVATLDMFSNVPRRWPQGNIWYLYGSFFMQWIAETFGEQAIRAMIDDYGRQIIPFGVNRSIRRATGRTFEELYPVWIESMRRTFEAEARGVRALGLREGARITHTGYTVEHPRWVPERAWTSPDGARHNGDRLAYFVDDGHTPPGWWMLPPIIDERGSFRGADESKRALVLRTNGVGGLSFLPDGAAVFSSQDVFANLFLYDDLFELPAGLRSPTGLDDGRIRLTEGFRALDPSLSPDGRRVVFTTNHRGTSTLMIADLVPADDRLSAHRMSNVRPLVVSEPFDQAYTPRWSPDGRLVAYSSWHRGGSRDVKLVDAATGAAVNVTADRAIDGDPVFSPDGRTLYFHSDRTGISNLYAFRMATGDLFQVTNVVNGAYQPEPSPDGQWLAYVGYTHTGYDVFVMRVDESTWTRALPYVDDRGAPPSLPTRRALKSDPYNPLLTMSPRTFSARITPGVFGYASIVTATGSDIAGEHAFALSLTTEFEEPELQPSLTYSYGRLPFDLGVSGYRAILPQSNLLVGRTTLPWNQEIVGATTGASYALPRAFDSQSFNVAYTFAHYGGRPSVPPSRLNPYDTPQIPQDSFVGTLHLGWSYSNSQGFLWSVSDEWGLKVGASFDVADPALAGNSHGYAASLDLATYWPMPWLRHHVLAFHARGGASGGTSGAGAFYVGGFEDLPLVDVVQNVLIQGGVQLRGYPIVEEVGNYAALFNAEYRFPIVNVDRGLSTLPIFLSRINGALFGDYGSAFQSADTAYFKLGVGGELWFDMQLGYVLDFTFRAGYAKGMSSDGLSKAYFVAAVPF